MNMDEFDWFIEDMMEKASVEIPGSSPFCLYFFANKCYPIMLNLFLEVFYGYERYKNTY